MQVFVIGKSHLTWQMWQNFSHKQNVAFYAKKVPKHVLVLKVLIVMIVIKYNKSKKQLSLLAFLFYCIKSGYLRL